MTDNQIENQMITTNYICQKCDKQWVLKMGLNPPEIVSSETVPDCITCNPPEIPQQT